MKIVADTHVHFYPCYDTRLALCLLAQNCGGMAQGGVSAAFLAERYDCNFFSNLKQGKTGGPGNDFKIRKSGNEDAIVLSVKDAPDLHIFPGRQIVTAERIEILALTTGTPIPDKLPAREVVQKVIDAGGVPVLCWAPGKWFLERGKIVRGLIEASEPGRILIGDTTLRPTLWPEPCLMRFAAEKGLAVIAGSDPLPFAGEEKYMGTFVSILEGEFDLTRPVPSIRAVLKSLRGNVARAGKRNGFFEMLRRLKANGASKAR